MNGNNMIDGANGILITNSLIQLCCIYHIVNVSTYNFEEIKELIILFIITLIFFLFLNFPKSKIFMGDFGAYFLSFFNGMLLIYVFSAIDILSWVAVLIFIYPAYELFFTFCRRLITKNSITTADTDHLHTRIYKHYLSHNFTKNTSNNLVLISLLPLNIIPLSIVFLGGESLSKNLGTIAFLISFFIILYHLYFSYFKIIKNEK